MKYLKHLTLTLLLGLFATVALSQTYVTINNNVGHGNTLANCSFNWTGGTGTNLTQTFGTSGTTQVSTSTLTLAHLDITVQCDPGWQHSPFTLTPTTTTQSHSPIAPPAQDWISHQADITITSSGGATYITVNINP